jgi:hypothetical protein
MQSPLTGEMLERVRSGAAPVPPRDRRRYFDLISASLAKCPLLTNAALMDAIRAAQRELLRPPAKAA